MYQPLTTTDAHFQCVDWKLAQPWCNFVLMQPEKLPSDLRLMEKQLRAESAEDVRSTYRCIIGDEKRRASLKQFLYDWAPPAYDHPNLWRNPNISSVENTPTPQPHLLGSSVIWTGLNYRRQPALSLNLLRTNIEITAIEGHFSTEELLAICQGLQPVDTAAMQQIINTSLAELSYSYRHLSCASPVPLSYWRYTRQEQMPMQAYAWEQAPKHILKGHIELPQAFGYAPNAIFVCGSPENPAEIEYYYEHLAHPGCYIRLLTTPHGSQHAMAFPPQLGTQCCRSATLDIEGRSVYHAFLTEQFGPHEAVWQRGEQVVLLLVKPAPWTDREWLLKLLHTCCSL